MKGGKNKKPHGYTVIEVMIFMAVSGFMFIVAATFISGKQATVEFRQGMTSANSLVRSLVNEVANGEYKSLGNYSCVAPAGSGPTFPTSDSATDQGASGGTSGCTFFGKVIQLDVGGDTTAYNVYSVAARQFSSGTSPVTSFADALPVVVGGSAGPDFTARNHLNNGLEVTGMLSCSASDSGCASGSPIGAVGFFGSFGSYSATDSGDLQSGAQSVITAVVPNVTYGDSESAAISDLNSNLKTISGTNVVGSGNYVLLCFRNGNKTGTVAIGGPAGQQFTTTMNIGKVPAPCAA